MKRFSLLVLLSISIGLYSQKKQQISLGSGLNNVQNRLQSVDYQVVSTNCILALNYNYSFRNNIGLRGTVAFASFEERYFFYTGDDVSAVINALAINIGPMYHFLINKKLDLSSGFSLGRKFRRGVSGDPYHGLPTSFYVYSINLINVKYYPFNEKIGFFGEVIIDEAYHSNYFLGLAYQF